MKGINRLGCLFILAVFVATIPAQSGGQFQIEKSVIAGGGGQTTGGQFILDATIAESVAGTSQLVGHSNWVAVSGAAVQRQ